ncbi:MAG: putative pectin lyase [Rhodospirillales bacterium]|nr:putative pectin lyase [Rhodospirillales bacterium]
MSVLWVGKAEQYTSLSSAVKAANAGDTINIRAGVYLDDDVRVDKPLTIVGVGGMAHLEGTKPLANGKGLMIVNTTGQVTLENLEFSGAQVSDNNGAGIRWSAGDLTIKNSSFHDNQDGILSLDIPNGHLKIQNTEFANNGAGDGFSHGIYINKVASVEVTDSYFHDTQLGHQIKSRAAVTTVTNSVLVDGNGGSSFAIDTPNGGVVTITGNKIEQSADSDNPAILHYGGETSKGTWDANTLTIDGNTIVNQKAGGYVLAQQLTPTSFDMGGNAFYGVTQMSNVAGVTAHDSTTLTSVPDLLSGLHVGDNGTAAPVIQVDANAIARLYAVGLDRAPDAGGLSFWVGQEQSGMSHTAVAQAFVNSPEFQTDTAALSNGGFLSLLYNTAFHRAPDAAGEQAWLQFLGAGHGRGEVLLGFADSAEMKAATAAWAYTG